MSSTLTELIATRRNLAVERAAELADQLATGDERSVTKQTQVEQALADLRHYRALETDLAEVAQDLGVYNRHSSRSIVRDLRSQDRDAQARIIASHRAAAADAGMELRDFGSGTALAAVPAWLVAEARPTTIVKAPLLNLIAAPLPGIGLELRMPRWSTEPAAGVQSALNAALPAATFVDAEVPAAVRTYGCQVDVAVQMLDQSPIAVDRHVLPTLVAAVDAAIEADLWVGDGSGGTVEGLLNADGTNTETFTDTTPTLVEFIPRIEALIREVETAGGDGGTPVLAVHPRRLSWLRQTSAVEKVDLGWTRAPFPGATVGLFGGTVAVIADPAAPTALGASTNEDRIVVLRSLDVLDAWASTPRVTVNEGATASGELTARIVVSRMVAFTAERIPGAVGILSGTGLAAP